MATTSWIKTFLLLLFCQLFYCQQNETTIKNHIKNIRKELFETRGYDPKMRPTLNFTAQTNITLNFGILYIQKLDFQKGFLESTVFIGLRWRDEHLAWSADQFGGLVEIRVAASEVFTPDIVLVNRVDNDDDVVRRSAGGHADLILLSSGLLAWAIPVSVKSTCSVDLTEWPYDEQRCNYRFASWFYNGNAMNLVSNSDKVTGGLFHESPQWAMVGNECVGSREARGEDDFFPEVNCYLRLKRRSANYRYTVYLPVICALLLNLLSFFLNVAGRLRFQLVSIAFGSLFLELLYLAVKLDSVSSLGQPKVVIYLGQMVVFVACTLLWSTFASHLVASGHLEVPPKVIKVIEPLSPWLVSNDVEAMSLAKLANAGDQASSSSATQHRKTMPNNVMFVQIVDKILFALFLLLAIVLHN